jgi:anti-anti-sigma factor
MATASEPDRASTDGFAVDVRSDLPRLTLALKGELDLATAARLELEVDAVPWSQIDELVFDLADVTFIDSTGLAVLIRASQRAAAADAQFSVIRVPDQPRKLFTIANVADRLNIRP